MRTNIYQDALYVGYIQKDEQAAEADQEDKLYVWAFNPIEKIERMVAKVRDGSRVVTTTYGVWKKVS